MWIAESLPDLILGSGSPRRHEVFNRLGLRFDVLKADIDESWPKDMPHPYVAQHLAEQKSHAIQHKHASAVADKLLVTADTVVLIDGRLLEKPRDRGHAREMLQTLSGSTHSVVTGVAMAFDGRLQAFSNTTRVTFRELMPQEIDAYLDSYQYADKAGGYGIQDGIGLVGVTKIEGCFYNVLGFPTSQFVVELRDFLKSSDLAF